MAQLNKKSNGRCRGSGFFVCWPLFGRMSVKLMF